MAGTYLLYRASSMRRNAVLSEDEKKDHISMKHSSTQHASDHLLIVLSDEEKKCNPW